MCVYVNVRGQHLGLFGGIWGRGWEWWQAQLCWTVGEKELTRRELMSDMTLLAGAPQGAGSCRWLSVFVCFLRWCWDRVGTRRRRKKKHTLVLLVYCYSVLKSEQTHWWNTTFMDGTPDCCVTRSFSVHSLLHLLFSLPPYHIPLLNLLALKLSKFLRSILPSYSTPAQSHLMLVKWSRSYVANWTYNVGTHLFHLFLMYSCFILFYSSVDLWKNKQTNKKNHTHFGPFYSLSLLSVSITLPSVPDRYPQSPQCLVWPAILLPSPLSLVLSILVQPSMK